jgi:hypothetical protein
MPIYLGVSQMSVYFVLFLSFCLNVYLTLPKRFTHFGHYVHLGRYYGFLPVPPADNRQRRPFDRGLLELYAQEFDITLDQLVSSTGKKAKAARRAYRTRFNIPDTVSFDVLDTSPSPPPPGM